MENYIHESNLIEGYDDPRHDETSLHAWDYLAGQSQLSHGVVCKLQKIITTPQDDLQPHMRGYYRDMAKVNVFIGNDIAPAWWLVNSLMSNWLLDYSERDAKTNHIAFEHIHPFCDGNGRTGRMLMWWQQIKRGERPQLITNGDKLNYYKWFR